MKLSVQSSIEAEPLIQRSRYTVDDLVERVRWAVEDGNVEGVRSAFTEAILDYPGFLPERFLKPTSDHYARREIYSDPDGRFQLMAMVWAPGQGTMLHDHDGLWVVEAVYQGEMSVQEYDYLGMVDGLHQFREGEEHLDAPGISGRRIPPDEHHVLRNTGSAPAVTIHAFGGILKKCNVFEARTGGYKMLQKFTVLDLD